MKKAYSLYHLGSEVLEDAPVETAVYYLHNRMCDKCIRTLPYVYLVMSAEDQLEELLMTECGAEWFVEDWYLEDKE